MGHAKMMVKLGGMEVGLVVGAELVMSEWIRINAKPQTKWQNHNCDQKHNPKENWDQGKRMHKEPLDERSKNHHHIVPNVGRPQVGNDTPGNQGEDGKLESQEQTHQGLEEVKHSWRLERHQPSGRIQNKEEVGLSRSR